MIQEKYIVDGSDFKNLPIPVSSYVRSQGEGHNVDLKLRVKEIKEFVDLETKWDLNYWYKDNDCSSMCPCGQPALREMLDDIFLSEIRHKFDMIVVTDFSQITRNQKIIDSYLEDGELSIPVYCIDEDIIVTSNPDYIRGLLSEMLEEEPSVEDVSRNVPSDDILATLEEHHDDWV